MHPAQTPFAIHLARPDPVNGLAALASGWFDQTAVWRLSGLSAAPPDLGAHVRRSFLGALGPGASDAARSGAPCDWDPPCALDVFCREQLRDDRGNGLPKPYVISVTPVGDDLDIALRVFGMANDWFAAAAEAMGTGLRDILPWSRVMPGVGRPRITGRTIVPYQPAPMQDSGPVVIRFLTPVDISGTRDIGAAHLSRLLRRVNGMAFWQGQSLSDHSLRQMTEVIHGLVVDTPAVQHGTYESPNRHGQKRLARTMTGALTIPDLPGELWPLLQLGERCHWGKHAVEGLGRFTLEVEN